MLWKRTIKESLEYVESIINAVCIPIIALNQNLNVISVSRSFMQAASLQSNQRLSGSSGGERRL